jgi:HSP20 family protein
MAIVRYRPLKGLIDRFFEQDLMPHFLDRWESSVPVDIYEKKGQVHMDFELPGLSKDDISIELNGDTLTVSGKVEKDKTIDEENYYRSERSYGEFSRSFTIPSDVKEKDIKAKFDNGILKITFPKTKEIEAKKKIQID